MILKKLCYVCDLVDNFELIEQYKNYYLKNNIWFEIIKSIRDFGIVDMEIYIVVNRLFMIMEIDEIFIVECK